MSSETESRAYLTECFAHDAGSEPGAILQLRREHRGLQPAKETAPRISREGIDAELSTIRDTFYQLAPDELRRRIAAIDATAFPDLNRLLERLQRVAALREDIDLLGQDVELDEEFFELFTDCMIAPRRTAVRKQTAALERMSQTRWRKTCQASARRIESVHSSLAALTPGWFEQINRKPVPISKSKKSSSILGFLGIYFLIRLIVYAMRAIFGDGDS